MAFTKLDSGIVNSTLWVHPHDVLRVWIAMLAQCNADGIVRAAAPALANLCMIPIDRMREILLLLESPDPDSRSSGDEGRRIKKIEGGWQLVNYLAYRNARDQETRREQNRESQRRHRDKVSQGQHLSASVSKVSTVSQSQPASAQAESNFRTLGCRRISWWRHSASKCWTRGQKVATPAAPLSKTLCRWAKGAFGDKDRE